MFIYVKKQFLIHLLVLNLRKDGRIMTYKKILVTLDGSFLASKKRIINNEHA